MTRIAHTTLDSETGYACVIHAGRHELTADESTARGGTDTGPAPYQLLLSGLTACTATPLPGGTAEALAARGPLGVLLGVLAQPHLQCQAHRLGQIARGVLEALDDRVRLDRVAGGEARPDEFPGCGRPAVVEVALALAPNH